MAGLSYNRMAGALLTSLSGSASNSLKQESSLWPAKASLHCTFIVSRAKHFLGKPLRGASLLGSTSMTFGFFLALFLFLVELLVFGFTGGSDEGDFALFYAGKSGAIHWIKERFAGMSLFEQERVHDWAQYLEELEALSYTDKFAVPTKIYTALKNKAPFEIVEQIVLNGHELDGIHISALAMYLNVQQLQKLENYGVDLTLSTSASGSAIVNSLLHKGGSSVFEYLISKKELVSSTEFDVLKEVLVMSYNLERPPIYAKKLIERGAVVFEETKAWVENELKTKDPRYYSLVKVHLNI